MEGLTPRHWLITGISSGLGRALAKAVLDRGDCVVGTSRSPGTLVDFERSGDGRAVGLHLDLRSASSFGEAVGEAARRLGGLDLLVNNAGYALTGPVEEIPLDDARAQMEINFFAPLAMMQACLPLLRESGRGRIINIASIAALESYRGLGLYCASKAALAALSEALAVEAEWSGVGVTSVEAGGFRTDFAGSNRRRTSLQLPVYDRMLEQMEAAFERSHGNQLNDPDKGAEALIALADLRDPPRHLALGVDSVSRIREIFARRAEEYVRFQPIGADTRA